MAQAPQTPQDPQGYVFVVTYGRSGSTLVQNLLNALPGYCIRGENENAVGHVAMAWHKLRGSDHLKRMAKRDLPTSPEDPWYGGEAIQPSQFARGLARVYVRQILRPPPGTRIAGCKEIRWNAPPAGLPVALDFLRLHLPNVRFVFNTRDHAQVARSGWWAKMDEAQVFAQLTQAEAAFKRYVDAQPDHCHTIHYNDYVADPDRLQSLFDFLKEPWDPALVRSVLDKPLLHLKAPPEA